MKYIALIAVAAMAAPAFSGVYVETVDNNLATGTTHLKQKMYVQDGNGRFVDDAGRVTLIKGGSLYFIDDADKSYVVFDKATMEALAKQLNDAFAKLPPDQREMMEQMMQGQGQKWTVDVKDTGKSDKVDGRNCKLWDVLRNSKLDEQICVVPFAQLPGKEDFQTVFANFAKSFEEMAKSVPMLAGKMEGEFSATLKTNGFPVRRRPYENGTLVTEESVVKVWREEAVPASMFEIPAGYKVKQMPKGPGM